ncbi:succinyldiaminopimelate transaminase [Naumannella huperziae]
MSEVPRARALPDFPWDTIAGAKARAAAHPDGIVDLSVGTPVDPTPAPVREALAAAADAPGYPATTGTPDLRAAQAGYLARRFGVPIEADATLPLIGTKEFVAWLPTLLGLGPGDRVVVPSVAYPTYAVGAALCGATVVATDDPGQAGDARLAWVNSPGNPTGRIASEDELRAWVEWSRATGGVLAGDECYAEFGWEAEPATVLGEPISGGDHQRLLALHSLSKRSNMAGYRAGFVAGDPALIRRLLEMRKHAGMIPPGPIQAASVAAYGDDAHVAEQRARYLGRRAVLAPALAAAGFRIEHSEGSLYLWATREENCRETVDFLAGHGILVAPGDFYGDPTTGADRFVRVALTATDERIAAAARRLSEN